MTELLETAWSGNIDMHSLAVPLEAPYGAKARIGLLALSTDLAIERDFARMAPDGDAAVFTTRIRLETPNSDRTFLALQDEIADGVRLLVPDVQLSAVVFGCTTASTLIGPERIAEIVAQARPDTPCTNPASGTVAALRAIGARSVAVVTPYTKQMTGNVTSFLEAADIPLRSVRSLGYDTDIAIGSVPVAGFAEAVRASDLRDADAVFISCTATKALNSVEALEAEIGIPVIASNQAALWHALRLSGWRNPIPGFGRLLREYWEVQ